MLNYTLIIENWGPIARSYQPLPGGPAKYPNIIMVICLGLLFLYSPVSPAQSQAELKEIEQTIEQTEQALKRNRKDREQALSRIQTIEKQIAERDLRYERTRNKANILDSQASLLESEREALNEELVTTRARLANLLESAYLMGRQSGLKVLLSQQGTQHVSRLNQYALALSEARKNQLDALQSLQQQLAEKDRQLRQQQAQLQKLSAALEEDQRYLAQLKKNRLAMVSELDTAIAAGTQEIDHLNTRREKLRKVLEEITRRQQARAARKRAQQKRLQAIKNLPPQKQAEPRPAPSEGKLPLPTEARIVAHFGDLRKKKPSTLVGHPDGRIRWVGDQGDQRR